MTMVSPDDGRPSISRTARYKKVTKPLLERKRRARINRCLDELKDLMVGAFEVEGDNISKLEKADILELTVRHLTKLHSPNDPIADAKRFQAGFGQCATEACQFILSMPGVDTQIGQNLIKHLHNQISEVPLSVQAPSKSSGSPPVSPAIPVSDARINTNEWSRGPVDVRENHNILPEPRMIHVKQELPHVPINQSLMCDTASMHSAPGVYDLSKPMTGLLMTVDNNQQANSNYAYNNYNPYSVDGKKKQEAEEKKKIMKKIRDQILGRQVRDVEPPKSTVSSTSHDQQLSDRYQNYEMRYRNCYNQEEQRPSSTVDLRKRSKGESKHYSPYYESRQHRREESNVSQHAINYSVADRKKNDDYEPSNYHSNSARDMPSVSDAESYSIKKRHADYRSIHPKKVLIRPMMDMKDEHNRNQTNAASTSNEPVNYSSLRHQRPMSSHRYQESTSDRMHAEHPNNPNVQHNYSNSYNRYLSSTEYRRMMERAAQNGNDSDDNMWRPW